MSRITPIDPKTATGKTKELFAAVEKKVGSVPNMMRAMAQSPAVLEAYLALTGALAGTKLSAKIREQLALALGEVNQCEYCVSAHTFIGSKIGLDNEAIDLARQGKSSDPKIAAILTFARELVVRRGEVKDADLRALRTVGVTDTELAEIVAVVSLNIFTNWFNHVADPEIDFPRVKLGAVASATATSCSTGSCT